MKVTLISVSKQKPSGIEGRSIATFDELVARHQRGLVSLACRMLGDLEDARDAVQEVFAQMWRRRDAAEYAAAPFSLAARMVMNHCIDLLRRRKRSPLEGWPTSRAEPEAPDSPEKHLARNELRSILDAAMARLKPKQKAVFVLRDVEGYSVRETADMLDCSENNVLVTLHHARKNLRKWLAPYLKE